MPYLFTSYTLRISYWICFRVCVYFSLFASIFSLHETIPILFSLFKFFCESEVGIISVLFDLFHLFICTFISVKRKKIDFSICCFLQTTLDIVNRNIDLVQHKSAFCIDSAPIPRHKECWVTRNLC